MKGSILISRYIEENIRSAFTQDKKGTIEGRTKIIFDNTIEFLMAQKVKMPYYYYIDASDENRVYEVFGRLGDKTIIRVTKQKNLTRSNRPTWYEIENIIWDVDTLDKDIFHANELNPDIFNQILTLAEKQGEYNALEQ